MFDAPAIDATPPQLDAAKARASRSSALPRSYLALWAGLTGVAGLYLTQVSLSVIDMPKMMAGAETAAANPSAALQAEIATLRHNLGDFQRDLGRVRADLEAHKQDASVIASVAALEERMSMTTGLALAKREVAPVSMAQAQAPVAAVVEAAHSPALKVAAVPESGPAPAPVEPRVISLAPPALDKLMAPIETGSIPAAAAAAGKMSGQLPKAATGAVIAPVTPGIAHPVVTAAANAAAAMAPLAQPAPQAAPIGFGPALVKPEPKPFAVHLASGASVDDIRYNWSILSTQHADALSKLTPRFTSTGTEAAGKTFDLIAGPVKTAADAKKICKTLATRGMDCKVSPYEGDAF